MTSSNYNKTKNVNKKEVISLMEEIKDIGTTSPIVFTLGGYVYGALTTNNKIKKHKKMS